MRAPDRTKYILIEDTKTIPSPKTNTLRPCKISTYWLRHVHHTSTSGCPDGFGPSSSKNLNPCTFCIQNWVRHTLVHWNPLSTPNENHLNLLNFMIVSTELKRACLRLEGWDQQFQQPRVSPWPWPMPDYKEESVHGGCMAPNSRTQLHPLPNPQLPLRQTPGHMHSISMNLLMLWIERINPPVG